MQREKGDFSQAVLSFTLSLGFTGVLTNVLKIIVGMYYLLFLSHNYLFDYFYWMTQLNKYYINKAIIILFYITYE